jgi:hypothetical protein
MKKMKNLFLLLLISPLLFSCEDANDILEINLIETLKDKVYYKDIPNGRRYVHFDLSLLDAELLGGQYEGWTYYEKNNDDPNQAPCSLTNSVSSFSYGLHLKWYRDTIINNSKQFVLEGIYGQNWIVTKDYNDKISIVYTLNIDLSGGVMDDGYSEISLEEFMSLDCL